MIAAKGRGNSERRSEQLGRCSHVIWACAKTAVLVTALVITGNAAGQQKSVFRIVESGYASPRTGATLVWLDSSRVLFNGGTLSAVSKARYPESEEAAKWANPWTFVWDTASDNVERISDWNTVCYSPTYIRQYKRPKYDSLRGKYRLGPLGKEMELNAEAMSKRIKKDEAQQRIYRNSFDCREYAPSEIVPPIPPDRKVVLLREGDGYLDLGSRDPVRRSIEMKSGHDIRWYHPTAESGVDLGMPLAHNFGLHSPRYSSYSEEYVVVPAAPDAKTSKGSTELIYYVLHPSSLSAEKVTIPNFAPGGGFTQGRIERTKSGWVFSGSGNPWLRWAGIYHYDSKKVTRIDLGSVTALSVAPDGCKVAYTINKRNTEMGSPIEVNYVNLCVR